MNVTQKVQEDQPHDLEPAYAGALEDYLSSGGEDALQRAYEIGRTALTDGLGVLEMATMHHAALAQVLESKCHAEPVMQELERAQEFFGESLSPYEMAHRGFRDAISTLHRLNETLEQEIQRIAHAVHDEAGQLLVAARLAFNSLPTVYRGERSCRSEFTVPWKAGVTQMLKQCSIASFKRLSRT